MNNLFKKICVFIRCRERAAIVVAAVFMVGIVLTSHVVTISAFSGYNLRYPVDQDSQVDLSLHYIRFSSMYENITINLGGGPITYTSILGGRSAYVEPDSLYTYFSDIFWHLAVRADRAEPRLTAREIYTVSVPSSLILNSGDYWGGFSDWQIKAPDPFGNAYYRPENGSTVQPSDLVDDGVLVYYPDIGASGFFGIDDTYPPVVEFGVCDEPSTVIDLSNYLSEVVYNTVAVNDVGQIVNIEQSVLDEFIEGIYGSATDGVFAKCIEVTFGEGSIISSDVVGSYENGPRYELQFLKFTDLVGNGGFVNAETDGRYTFEFVFNQAIAKYPYQGPGLDTSVRLYNQYDDLIETMVVSAGDLIVGNSRSESDPEIDNALFVTFGTALIPGETYSVVLGKDVVESANGAERMRSDMSLSTYEITVAHDDDAPIVVTRSIATGAVDVATSTQTVHLTFDEPIVLGSIASVYQISNGVSTSTVTATSIGQYDSVLGSTHTIDIAGIVNQGFSTTTGLAAGTTYTLQVLQGVIQDDQGNLMSSPEYFVFTTVSNPAYDDTRPIVVTKTPTFGSVSIATSTQDVTLVFDEPVYASTSVQTFRISNGVSTSTVTAVSVGQYDSVSGDTLTIEIDEIVNQGFSTTTGLAAETTYTLEVPQHIVRDDSYEYMAGPAYFVFTTVDNFEEPTPEEENEEEDVVQVEENNSRPPSSRRARQGVVGGGTVVDGTSSASLGAGSDASVDGGTVSIFRDLFYGATGTDVLELQRTLNQLGFTVSETGAGSVGQETQYFGSSTQAAVTRFQINFGIFPSFGYFGPVTRALLGLILGQ